MNANVILLNNTGCLLKSSLYSRQMKRPQMKKKLMEKVHSVKYALKLMFCKTKFTLF